MVSLARQEFSKLRCRILAVKELRDGTIGMIEFDDSQDPDDLGIVSVTRFRLVRRGPVTPQSDV